MKRIVMAALGLLLVGCSVPVSQHPQPEAQPSVLRAPDLIPTPAPQTRAPERIWIPALSLDADITSVGMVDDVTMEVPDDIRTVGWFRYSVHPGVEHGSVVLAGHRDGHRDPNGVFLELEELEPGSGMWVVDGSQQWWFYRVDRVEVLTRSAFAQQAASLFRRDGQHRLVLVTCGGKYDAERGGYQSNVVVTASAQ